MKIRLREVRERKFITQEELAERTGITRANISRLENGLQRPRISTVRRLATALGVEPEELIDWEAGDHEGTKKVAA